VFENLNSLGQAEMGNETPGRGPITKHEKPAPRTHIQKPSHHPSVQSTRKVKNARPSHQQVSKEKRASPKKKDTSRKEMKKEKTSPSRT